MTNRVQLTFSVLPEFKKKIFKMVESSQPRVTVSSMGVYLLELGIEQHKNKEETNNGKERGT